MRKRTEEWIEEYRNREAYWLHDGNPKRPHALLTSGLHSNGFFNSKPVIADDVLLAEVAKDLVERFRCWCPHYYGRMRVVGPATGATKLARYVSEEFTNLGLCCDWASPVKTGEGRELRMVFTDPDRKPLPGEIVWFVEDVLTTGGSVERAVMAVKAEGATPFLSVGAIVNRSGLTTLPNGKFERRILASLTKTMPMWAPEECPLCKDGSEAIRPKTPPENWARLNADY